jgi:hypothetical protein
MGLCEVTAAWIVLKEAEKLARRYPMCLTYAYLTAIARMQFECIEAEYWQGKHDNG